MTFEQELEPELKSMLNRAIIAMHGDAIDYAPRGYTQEVKDSLRGQIYFIKAKKRGNKITASLVSKAEYSSIVHDAIKRHASSESGFAYLSYTDFGTSSTASTAYGQGYRLKKDSSDKYATEFLDRAIRENQDLIK